MAKISISIDDDLLSRLDLAADDNYMTRSGYISAAVAQMVNANDMIRAVNNIAFCMRKIADNGVIDDDTKKELEELETFCNLFSKKQ